MTPDECRELAAELPETSGMRAALLMDADRQERGDTSPIVFEIVRDEPAR